MIIFGSRGYLRVLAMVNFVCNNCHNPAAQKVTQRLIKFTLFFIPLFPISSSYSTTCTFCGLTTKIDKTLAEQYVAYSQQPQQPSPQVQQVQQQPVAQNYAQGNYPQQPHQH